MKKAFKYILIGLLVGLGLWCVVSYIINPSGTVWTLNYIWEILNKPLPIIGITTLAVLYFLFKCFVATKYGKKALNDIVREKNEIKEQQKEFLNNANSELENLKAENEKLKKFIVHICELSTNQKIKNFGKELLEYGKETVDSETKAE